MNEHVVKVNKDVLKAIKNWQNDEMVHPLTCGNDSNHKNLIGKEVDNNIVLVCLDCDYVQDYIPEYILTLAKSVRWGSHLHEQKK